MATRAEWAILVFSTSIFFTAYKTPQVVGKKFLDFRDERGSVVRMQFKEMYYYEVTWNVTIGQEILQIRKCN